MASSGYLLIMEDMMDDESSLAYGPFETYEQAWAHRPAAARDQVDTEPYEEKDEMPPVEEQVADILGSPHDYDLRFWVCTLVTPEEVQDEEAQVA